MMTQAIAMTVRTVDDVARDALAKIAHAEWCYEDLRAEAHELQALEHAHRHSDAGGDAP